MDYDIHNWEALTPDEAYELLQALSVPWWIAGGWAIDLFLGEQTRAHEDIDVLILRRDQLAVQAYLAGWDLYKTQQPGLKPWPAGEFLEPGVNDIWCRRSANAPWALQLMLMDTQAGSWVYRRSPDIGGPLASIGRRTRAGIPYLAPEIQLLYKAREETLAKDQAVFERAAPRLPRPAIRWLLSALRAQFPNGHPWAEALVGMSGRTNA